MTRPPLSTSETQRRPASRTSQQALSKRLISIGRKWLLPAALGLGALLIAAALIPQQDLSFAGAQSQVALNPQLPGQFSIIIPENNWGWGWALLGPLQITATTNNPLLLADNSQQLLVPLAFKVLLPLALLTGTPLLLIAVKRSWRRIAFRAAGLATCFWLIAVLSLAASYMLAEQPRFLRHEEQSAQLWAIYQDYQRPVPALPGYEIPGQELLYPQQPSPRRPLD